MQRLTNWCQAQEEKEKEEKRKMRKIQPELVARKTAGYLQPTKAAKAKMAVRKYVLDGVKVEVPQVTFSLIIDLQDEKVREFRSTDDLFVGRHTYRDAENVVTLVRDDWKEQVALQHGGYDVDEARRCRVLGLEYEW